MEPFIGEFNRRLDEKYRVSVPSKFKGLFQGQTPKELIIRVGKNCLILQTIEGYRQLPKDIKDSIEAEKVIVDSKNRMVIPPGRFREMLKIGEKVSFKGIETYVELTKA